MSVTIKTILHSRKNKDNKYPLAIRIYENGKYSLVFLGYALDKSQWDDKNNMVKKNHPNSTRLNAFIIKKIAEINEKHLTLDLENKDTSAKSIHTAFSKKDEVDSFNREANLYITNLKSAGSYNRLTAERPRVNRFKEFIKGKDIQFQDINVSLLNQFRAYLKGTRKISERTIINHLIVVRSIYSQAIQNGTVDRKHYPFGRGKIIIKFPDSLKVGLSKAEVKKIENCELEENSSSDLARDIWLISFYFAGMRISDVLRLKWSDFKEDRLHYKMGKNEKGGSFAIPVKAQNILVKYKRENPKHDLVFPFLETIDNLNDTFLVQKRINQGTHTVNKYLKKLAVDLKIDKTLTMHIARHTFGNISGDQIPIQMLQKLYRHSSILTTIGYQANFINKDMDDALNKVVG
jgi:integrase